MRDPRQPRTRESLRRRLRRLMVLGLAACAPVVSGCLTPGSTSEAKDPPPLNTPLVVSSDPSVPGSSDSSSFWEKLNFAKPPLAPPPPAETILVRADGIIPEPPPKPGSPQEMLLGAHELFRQGDYEKSAALYKFIADRKKTPMAVAEEARYYQAESLRLSGDWPKAADVYNDVLNKFPNSAYREQAIRHMYDIANFWLEDTRLRMKETREQTEGKRWFVPSHFVNIDPKKPVFDEEGRAIEKLEQVRYNDINGPLADQALFLAGSVKFFNQDFKEADNYFSQIHEKHPNSPLAERAVELAIVSKHLSTGGAEYDGRKVAEARNLVRSAFDNYPELANKKKDFLARQLVGITLQQAEKDYKMAEFWRRTGHVGAAYFYYHVVMQRYPQTPFAEMSRKKAEELRLKGLTDKNVITPPEPRAQLGRPGVPGDETAPEPRKLQTNSETAPQPRPAPAEETPVPRLFTPGVPQQ